MLRPFPSSMRAAANTPAEPVGACVAHFPTGVSLPRYPGGSASALHVSRPARRSLVLRPAWSLSRPWRPVTSECFRRCRYLHHPLRLLPAGTTVAGWDSHPLKNGAFHGAPDNPVLCHSCPAQAHLRTLIEIKSEVLQSGLTIVEYAPFSSYLPRLPQEALLCRRLWTSQPL